jgi:ring-1,2-phenylacetyl-CoA epoxidase subunit PaaD
MVTEKEIWNYLEEVFDPEIPVLTVVDLGVIIEEEIISKLNEKGISSVSVDLTLSPAWSTDWITESGKQKLLEYGIAPPQDEVDKSVLFAEPPKVPCPQCKSLNTRMVSLFGSTACKSQYQCNDCLEPFDYFKCLK